MKQGVIGFLICGVLVIITLAILNIAQEPFIERFSYPKTFKVEYQIEVIDQDHVLLKNVNEKEVYFMRFESIKEAIILDNQ